VTKVKAVFRTDRGRVRQHNEDNGGTFINRDGQHLCVVADGMGGHRAGDVASSMAIKQLEEMWSRSSGIETASHAEDWLKDSILQINQILFKHSQEHIECEGMGTTIVAAIATPLFSTVANIGDSRCYILNDTGFQQLTEDHSLVNELVRTGQISREDAEHHPRKNVLLRALGTEQEVKMDIRTIMFEEGDVLLLCSDGLSNKVTTEEMLEILKNEEELEEKASRLIHLANEHGGEDNITLCILQFDVVHDRGGDPC
jgi:PPM family protein phosphatase